MILVWKLARGDRRGARGVLEGSSQGARGLLAGRRRKNGLFVYRFGLILAKFEAPAKPQKITQIL